MKLYVGNFISRESCARCHFKGFRRYSDLTIGDFWGIWDIAPEMDDDFGTSVILCQSIRGTELLSEISDKLIVKKVTLEEASRYNVSMLASSTPDPRRQDTIDTIIRGDIAKCESLFRPSRHTLAQKLRIVVSKLYKKGERDDAL